MRTFSDGARTSQPRGITFSMRKYRVVDPSQDMSAAVSRSHNRRVHMHNVHEIDYPAYLQREGSIFFFFNILTSMFGEMDTHFPVFS